MLWLALHLPLLSLEAFAASLPAEAAQQPLALWHEHRLTALNAVARQAGVQAGLKRATALALRPDLRLGQADARRDAQALQAVAHAALAFTPSVCLHEPDGVLLEVSTCLRYFGGAARLLERLRHSLAPLGHQLQVAAAPTALGAALLARWRPGLEEGPHVQSLPALQALLDTAPVGLLAADAAQVEALSGMGLQRLGDLRRLPRAGLARRFGEPLLEALDRARGERPDPRGWITAPPAFDGRLELPARADSSEQVLHAAARLLAQLVAWARARHGRIEAFTLSMQHEARHRDGDSLPPATELRVALSEPSSDPGHLQGLLRERLAHCPLAAPTLELRLQCAALAQGTPPSGELFASGHSQREGLVRLLERLRARLGDERVQQLQPAADHRPEHATRWQAASVPNGTRTVPPDAADTGRGAAPPRQAACAVPLHRPAWLLPEPQPLPEHGPLPLLGGQPLQLLAGPERIEAGWWDGDLATRDYFIAQAADGALVWLYRSRLPRDPDASGWFLHGRFG